MNDDHVVPIYCVINESNNIVARAEGRLPVIEAMHKTSAGAVLSLAKLRAKSPDDKLTMCAMWWTPAQVADTPELPE